MIATARFQFVALAMLTMTLVVTTAPSQAALTGETCKVDADDTSSMTPCYQRELEEKTKANDQTYRVIAKEAKKRGRLAAAAAAKAKKNKKLKGKAKAKAKELAKEQTKTATAYSDFLERLNNTLIEGRKSALRSCVHMTGKFQDKDLSGTAIANCRTEAELQLEKQLKNFEIELTTLKNNETKN